MKHRKNRALNFDPSCKSHIFDVNRFKPNPNRKSSCSVFFWLSPLPKKVLFTAPFLLLFLIDDSEVNIDFRVDMRRTSTSLTPTPLCEYNNANVYNSETYEIEKKRDIILKEESNFTF